MTSENDSVVARSSNGETSFINHVPRSREQREALLDKDKLEKRRLEVSWNEAKAQTRVKATIVATMS